MRHTFRQNALRLERLEKRVRETDAMLEVLLCETEFTLDPQVGLNGQDRRKEVVAELFHEFKFDCVIETGTYLGSSTGYFSAQYGVPVYSSELVRRNHHTARRLLRNLKDVHLKLGDSRKFLSELTELPELADATPLFYLDAHWYDDLPLAEELAIIDAHWERYVALIDDFQVPGDEGYGYDDYGPGKSLDVSYLRTILGQHRLMALYPAVGSDQETGRRRGYAVIASQALAPQAKALRTLRSQ